MSHSYKIDIESSDEEESNVLTPTKTSVLLKVTPQPGWGLRLRDDSNVQCSIEIQNHTGLSLLGPQIRLKNGAVVTDAKWADFIEPERRDAFLLKAPSMFSGTYGTASWFISGKDRRVVIMFSVPRLPFYKNWLAVGFTKENQVEDSSRDDSWFHEMYGDAEKSSGILGFKRKAFPRVAYEETQPQPTCRDKVCRKSRGLENAHCEKVFPINNQHYVGESTMETLCADITADAALRENLIDDNRNTGFLKMATTVSNDMLELLCESDDLMFLFGIDEESICLSAQYHFFVKKDPSMRRPLERNVLLMLSRLNPFNDNDNLRHDAERLLLSTLTEVRCLLQEC